VSVRSVRSCCSCPVSTAVCLRGVVIQRRGSCVLAGEVPCTRSVHPVQRSVNVRLQARTPWSAHSSASSFRVAHRTSERITTRISSVSGSSGSGSSTRCVRSALLSLVAPPSLSAAWRVRLLCGHSSVTREALSSVVTQSALRCTWRRDRSRHLARRELVYPRSVHVRHVDIVPRSRRVFENGAAGCSAQVLRAVETGRGAVVCSATHPVSCIESRLS
jgi:hypothetical protein